MATPKPVARVQVDPTFEKRVRDLKEWGQSCFDGGSEGGQSRWFRPKGWAGDPADLAGMKAPFEPSDANAQVQEAMANASNPGVAGDLVAAQTMADWLACLERAFRARLTMSRPRTAAHALGRHKSFLWDKGPFGGAALEYVRGLVEKARVVNA